MKWSLPFLKKPKALDWEKFFELYREPVVTLCITPNNAPKEKMKMPSHMRGGGGFYGRDEEDEEFESNNILSIISSLATKFYLPERVRIIDKKKVKVKLNDLVSFKICVEKGIMKFYLTVPKRFEKSFVKAIRNDWSQVDITQVEEKVIKFNPNKAKAMDVFLRHHYALSIQHNGVKERMGGMRIQKENMFQSQLASVASQMDDNDKLLVDFNITPVLDDWRAEAKAVLKNFKNGQSARRATTPFHVALYKIMDTLVVIMEETTKLVESFATNEEVEEKKDEQPFEIQYSDHKIKQDTHGFKTQIRVVAESKDSRKSKHILKGVQTAFEQLNGDNSFVCKEIKTQNGIKVTIKAVEENKPVLMKPSNLFFEGEMNKMLTLPNRKLLKEYKKVIDQDGHTRAEVDNDFFDSNKDAIPFAITLDKQPKTLYFGGYEREWWTEKGRKALSKQALDDRCEINVVSGKKGSGKSEWLKTQILHTFAADAKNREEWKIRSKSVVAFDVADGQIITDVWNLIPEWLRDRVIILNHSNHARPIPLNFADIEEFNKEVLQDPDFAFELAEMEMKLIEDAVVGEKSINVQNWLPWALQCAHIADKDYGLPEAIRILVDNDFREQIATSITDEELQMTLETYNEMASEGKNKIVVNAIQNRLNQLRKDKKLWQCIAQRPIRDENGKCEMNWRKWMDGDEDGAYLVLIYIPKSGVTEQFRHFTFAHYFVKIWNVLLSREKGFAGREYRPETLVVVDELHQIVHIPIVVRVLLDIFKEVRKYSGRYTFTLHGWSSLASAGRNDASAIKKSIMENGCNLIFLQGGSDMFSEFEEILEPYTMADFNNLMKMEHCGIFSIRWKGKTHNFQAHLPKMTEAYMKKYDNMELNNLASLASKYSRDREDVRKDILNRIKDMAKNSIKNYNQVEMEDGQDIDSLGEEDVA